MVEQGTVYFMSGTGNSYRVAAWMGAACEKEGREVRVVPIETADPESEIEAGPRQLVGIVMPTHGFTAPWHMIRFVLGLPRAPGAHAFCVATRAGTRIGGRYFPGVGGTATFLIALLLLIKGFRVRGLLGVDMPSNWTAAHPGFGPDAVAGIIARAKPRARRFMQRILTGKEAIRTRANAIELALGILLLPVSVLYLLFGRFFLAKLFFANVDCTGCGLCAQSCPVGAIAVSGKNPPRPFWRYNCENCMRCMAYCPERAIEAGHSWGVLLFLLTRLPLPAFVIAGLAIEGSAAAFLLDALYFYASLFLAYLLFHQLLRVPVLQAFFTRTTFTRYWRRYHEPDTMSKHLGKPLDRQAER